MRKVYLSVIVFMLALIVFYCVGCTSHGPPQKNIPATIFSYEKKLCNSRNNPLYATAKKLNDLYQQTGGKTGLDDQRFCTRYDFMIRPSENFNWKNYILHHPADVVIADDNEYRIFYVLTNNVDRETFSPITYAYK